MMKALLFLLLGCTLAETSMTNTGISNQNQSRVCRDICKEYFETKLDKKFCHPTLNLIPRPGVHRACINGMIKGFKNHCVSACLAKESINMKAENPDSFSACKDEAKKSRSNNEFSWCRKGYDFIAQMIFSVIKESKKNDDATHIFDKYDGSYNDIFSELEESSDIDYNETKEMKIIDESDAQGKTLEMETDFSADKIAEILGTSHQNESLAFDHVPKLVPNFEKNNDSNSKSKGTENFTVQHFIHGSDAHHISRNANASLSLHHKPEIIPHSYPNFEETHDFNPNWKGQNKFVISNSVEDLNLKRASELSSLSHKAKVVQNPNENFEVEL